MDRRKQTKPAWVFGLAAGGLALFAVNTTAQKPEFEYNRAEATYTVTSAPKRVRSADLELRGYAVIPADFPDIRRRDATGGLLGPVRWDLARSGLRFVRKGIPPSLLSMGHIGRVPQAPDCYSAYPTRICGTYQSRGPPISRWLDGKSG
jgi:hypothetical protein